jgi:hypothetical protein
MADTSTSRASAGCDPLHSLQFCSMRRLASIPVPPLVEELLSGDTAKAAVIYGLMARPGADAVHLRADPGRAVGPVRAAACRCCRISDWPRLSRDGDGAERRLAHHRPDDFRHRVVQFRPPAPTSPT